jgi:hypothetical protein
MGSGEHRKRNDVVRINRPQKSLTTGNGAGSGSGGPIDINQMCPQAFEVRISPKNGYPDGTSVTVKGNQLLIINERVGTLSDRHIKTITECGGQGILYRGRVLNKNKNTYALFKQNIGR